MNKFMNEYFKDINNKEENFEVVKSKILKQKCRNRKILNIVAVILVVILIGSLSPQIYAKIQLNRKYKEYTRRDYVSGKGQIATAYSETVDMDYIYQNNIGIKIDSIILTDDTLKSYINIKLPDDMRADKKEENKNEETHVMYTFGYAIYDENNVVYDVFTRVHPDNPTYSGDYLTLFYKELGVKHNKNDLFAVQRANSGGVSNEELNDDIVVSLLETKSLKGFPNSKKLYIRIFDIGAIIFKPEPEDTEYLDLSNLEWSFEIETPDKFIKRETTNLVLLDEIPRLKIEKFTISETGTILKAQKKDVVETMGAGKDMSAEEWSKVHDALINITDEEGNIYYPVQGGTTEEKNGFYSFFEIDKDILENTTLYLNMKIGDEEYSSELQVSK